jgi:hypothetical protein
MSHRGVRNWPPKWTTPREERDRPNGEVGTLELTITHELFPHRLYLVMQFEGWRYMASVTFDDQAFCEQINALLEQHIGRSIKDIGDLDVSHTL